MSNVIAQTILAQLGGNRFIAMTGATPVAFNGGLIVSLPRRAANGINSVVVRLDSDDTYSVAFNARRGVNITQKASAHGVHAADLQPVFTEHTSLFTSLF